MLILAAEVGGRLAPTPEPVLGGRRIARLPHQLAPEALDSTRLIRAGETLGWAEATAEPVFLTRLLDAQAARCAPFRVFFPLTFSNTLRAGHPQVTVTNRMELYDLMRVLHRGCERVLGGIGSNWVHNPAGAMDLVGGQTEPPSSVASLWAWLRDPLIPTGEHALATQLRAQLGFPASQTSASVDALDRLGQPLRRRLDALGSNLVRNHNPIVRHVIKRQRRDLRAADGTPVFREVLINLHGEGDDDALVMSDMMASAYEDARAYCQRIARVRPGGGILKTLLLRRIGSSLRAGLLTARKLRDGAEQTLLAEEEEGAAHEGGSDVDREALEKLKSSIEKMEAAGDADPKLEIALRYLRREAWVERGCILFSQYLDTVLWLADQLAKAFPSRTIGIYGGQGDSRIQAGYPFAMRCPWPADAASRSCSSTA